MVWPEKQVAYRATKKIGDPPLREMIRPVVHDVATLAKAAQIAQVIVARVMVEVGCRQYDPCRPHLGRFL
jgi:hypothetical protein